MIFNLQIVVLTERVTPSGPTGLSRLLAQDCQKAPESVKQKLCFFSVSEIRAVNRATPETMKPFRARLFAVRAQSICRVRGSSL
jgi:hypothetical protein